MSTLLMATASLPILLTGAMAVQIQADLGFGATALGLCFAVFFGSAAVSSAPLGYLTQRFGPQASLRAASALSGLTLVGIATVAQSWAVLAVLLAIAGTSLGLVHPGTNILLGRALPPNRHGLATGIKQSGVPIATLLGGIAVPVVALTIGWRWGYVAGALLATMTTVLVPPDDPELRIARRQPRQGPPTSMGSRPALILLAVGLTLGTTGATANGAFAVTTAVQSGLPEARAGVLYAAASMIGVVARLVVGHTADRRPLSELYWVSGMLVLGAIGYLLLAIGSGPTVYLGVPLGVAFGWGWFGLFDLSLIRAYPTVVGSVTGVVKIGAFIGGILGPLGMGVIFDRYSLAAGWLTVCVLAILAAGCMSTVAAMRQRGRLLPEPVAADA